MTNPNHPNHRTFSRILPLLLGALVLLGLTGCPGGESAQDKADQEARQKEEERHKEEMRKRDEKIEQLEKQNDQERTAREEAQKKADDAQSQFHYLLVGGSAGTLILLALVAGAASKTRQAHMKQSQNDATPQEKPHD